MPTIKLTRLIPPVYYPVHRDIRSFAHREVWLRGGRGSGKSTFAALELALTLRRNPNTSAMVYRRVAATLRESVFAQAMWALERLGMQAGATVRLSPLEIRLRGGQRILFRGADDPGKSKSTKLAKGYFSYLWFEELSEFRGMEDIRQIQASIIRGGGPAVTVCTYNPPASMASWVNEESLSPDPNRLVHSSTYLDVPAQWLGEGFIAAAEALKAHDQAAYRHMYLGEATGLGTNVFRRLSLRSVTDAEIDALGEAYCGLDWGWFPDPMHFVRCGWNAAARRLVVYDELRAVRMDNRRLAEALRTRAEGCEIIADSAEPKSIADLRAEGLRCVAAWKGAGSVRAGLKWLQGLNEIVIDPARCPYAAREFSRYEYERDREGNPVDAYPDRDNHSIDAVRYAMNRVWMRAGA